MNLFRKGRFREHPTRFERVIFAYGGQTPTDPAVQRRRKLKGWASSRTSHDG
jgi:hypothetical protein